MQARPGFLLAITNLVLCFLLKEKALNLLTSTNLRFVRRFVLVLVRSALLRFVRFV